MMAPETVVSVDTGKGAHHQSQAQPQGQSGGNLDWLKVNTEHFQTLPGILKLVELVIGIICMACSSPVYIGATNFFLFVATTSFISTLIWVFIYLLSIREALRVPIHWVLTELLNVGIATVLYLLAFIVQLAAWSPALHYARGSNIAAGVFGLFNTLAYAASCYLVYLDYKSGENNSA